MKTYFQFTDGLVMNAAMSAYWREQRANGEALTAFGLYTGGRGSECFVRDGGDHSAFEAFLKREGLNYTKSTQSIRR